ncbi:MAG: sugar phosphate isomerase/epimerase family protein [Oligosphaeraceae bacterium]
MNAPLAFNYPWAKLTHALYPRIIREYLDWGVDTFVFTDPLVRACIEDQSRIGFLKGLCERFGIRLIAMHSPFGPKLDLNIPEPEQRAIMLQTHRRAMEIAADFGSRTYTMHIGAYHYVTHHTPIDELRPLAIQSLEQLLPTAERLGLVIAVENSFEPTNAAREVLAVIDPFLGSPAIGVCYDTGHAHIMTPYPWKRRENYPDYQLNRNWWEGFREEPDALAKLQPHVVTCHIHDNTGYADLHAMPFDGTIDWDALIPQLRACPRMLEFQTEQCFDDGTNWAGQLLAPAGGYSIRRQVETFRKLGFH